jgi:hypothetical protein
MHESPEAAAAVMREARGGVKGAADRRRCAPIGANQRLAVTRPQRHCGATEKAMTQTSNRFFDEIARLMNDAAGVASGVRREFDTLFRAQAERMLRDLDLVQREEFDAVKEMARLAREENEALRARISALEARLAGGGPPPTAS